METEEGGRAAFVLEDGRRFKSPSSAGSAVMGCWSLQVENAAAVAVAAEPPLFLTSLLLGWRDAIASWPNEVLEAVAKTEWDCENTKVVQIRGSTRVWTAAQRLLREVRAECEIEGRRATPDWYLRSALAGECILSLREFAEQLPKLLDDYLAGGALARSSPVVKAMTGAQALEAVAKAELVVDTIPRAVEELENLQRGHDPQPTSELEGLVERVRARRSPILRCIAEAVVELRPAQSHAAPDLFGQALFTLVHHTEQAIAGGDIELVRLVFQKVLHAALILDEHVRKTYKPSTSQINSAILDPLIDILELSGLAMVYEVLRGDQSADPVRQAWETYIKSCAQPESVAKGVLTNLDLADGGLSFGSPRGIARTEWGMRLSKRIVEAGYAQPEYHWFGDRPWDAPALIKMLGVSEGPPNLLYPRTIFAADVIGPLSGESEQMLRARPGLRYYYGERELHSPPNTPDEAVGKEGEGNEDSLQ